LKILDKIILVIFSLMILTISLTLCFAVAGWLKIAYITKVITYIITEETASKVTLISGIILVLLALKAIFFGYNINSKSKSKDGILLENESGKLLVTKDTIETLANTVIRNFEAVDNVVTKIDINEANEVSIFVTLFIKPDAVIKDLAAKLQEDIKTTIKESIELDITSVNVRIKNIATKKETPVKGQE